MPELSRLADPDVVLQALLAEVDHVRGEERLAVLLEVPARAGERRRRLAGGGRSSSLAKLALVPR